jgi:hypothetical protein
VLAPMPSAMSASTTVQAARNTRNFILPGPAAIR